MKLLKSLKERAKSLKAEIRVLAIAYTDARTPLTAKLLIGITVGYLLSPIDLIPDFIPVLGLLDDLLIVPLLITLSIKLIPDHVLSEARIRANENPFVFKKNNVVAVIIIVLIWIGVVFLLYKLWWNFRTKDRGKALGD
jgi:uncharacterized membrane protein YkvA (DUF1232 family)